VGRRETDGGVFAPEVALAVVDAAKIRSWDEQSGDVVSIASGTEVHETARAPRVTRTRISLEMLLVS
jgi:hypothetical protein